MMTLKTLLNTARYRALAVVALLTLGLGTGGMASAAPVDLNTASAAELAAAINGVGTVKAAAIIAEREENGPFLSVDDLTRVSGIGVKTVERNRQQMTVSGQAPALVEASPGAPSGEVDGDIEGSGEVEGPW